MAGALMFRRGMMQLNYLEEKPVVYKLRQLTYPVITSENLIKYISQSANVPESSIRSCVAAIAQAIAYFVINGHAVHFDGFGTFHIKMQAKVAKTEEELDTKNIRRLVPEFIWHKELREECRRTRKEISGSYSLSED